jgi:hypothetical protein
MKKKLFIIVFLLFALNMGASALDTLSIKYMPLHVGDRWVYNGESHSYYGNSYWSESFSVVFSRIVNNHIYYYLNSNNSYLFRGFYRVDSTTGSLYKYDSTGSCTNYHFEILSDSLAAVSGDTIRNCGSGSFKCTGAVSIVAFGDTTFKIGYGYSISGPGFSGSSSKSFIRKFGFNYYHSQGTGSGFSGSYTLILKGCKINEVVYGDTVLTGINQIISEIPGTFKLFQNYPNPFNPVTKIRFDIPPLVKVGSGMATLKIYDITGREIQTLVNEQLQPRSYEVTFDGSNLPSGVYFYQLRAGNFIETKKMLMIK